MSTVVKPPKPRTRRAPPPALSPEAATWLASGTVRPSAARLLAWLSNVWWTPSELRVFASADGVRATRQAYHAACRDMTARGFVEAAPWDRARPRRGRDSRIYRWRGPSASELEAALRSAPPPRRGRARSPDVLARREALIAVLREAGEPLPPREIARRAGRTGAGLGLDLRELVQAGRLRRVPPARYALADGAARP